MQSPFIQLTPAQSNKKSLVLAAIGVIAVVGVIYACFGVHTTSQTGFVEVTMVNHSMPNAFIVQSFENWTAVHNKTYESNTEWLYRLTVFAENFNQIKAHMDTGSDVKLAINKFADLTRAEFKAKHLSLDQRARNNNRTKNVTRFNTSNLPDKVDWRDKGAVTPVKDQGQCGSCWAFSATGAIEGAHQLATSELVSVAEQQLVDCSWDQGNEGCNGGLMDQAFDYVLSNGIVAESAYKYTARDGNCQASGKAVVAKITGYKDVAQNDESQLAAAVAERPVSVAIEADSLVFQFYSSGVIDSSSCGTDLDHGVLAVGYDSTASKPFWIVKNSWGSGWGDKGYVKILKSDKKGPGICGIAEMASYPTA